MSLSGKKLLVLFSIFSNDLENGSTFVMLAGDVRLGGVAGPWENRVRIQNDRNKLESVPR